MEDETFNTIMSAWSEEENPLQSTYIVTVKDIKQINETATSIKNITNIDLVKYGESMVNKLINVFDVVQRDGNGIPLRYELQRAHWHFLGNNMHKIESIGKAYTYMSLVRNKLQHWDNPNALGNDTTRVLADLKF